MLPFTLRLNLWVMLVASIVLAACPDLPRSPQVGSADPSDADARNTLFVPLSITRVFESAGALDGGERVAIHGEGIRPGAVVTFGEALATNVLVLDDTRINCTVPPASEPGLVGIRVKNLEGQEVFLADAYLYRGPLALIAISEESESPDQVGSIRGGERVTVIGEGFDDSTKILVGGRQLEEAERVDDTTIRGLVPARLSAQSGYVSVIASNGLEQRSLLRAWRYAEPLRVDWIAPANGLSAGGAVVTVYGAGLEPGLELRVGGVLAETVIDGRGDSMTFRAPPGSEGVADISLRTVTHELSLTGAFLYRDAVEDQDLEIGSLWPAQVGSDGGALLALSVFGLPESGAAEGLRVSIGEKLSRVIEIRPYENTVVVEAPSNLPGPVSVTVTRGSESTTMSEALRYVQSVSVTKVAPQLGSLDGADTVSLEGYGLDQVTQVFVGRERAEIVTQSSKRLDIVTPPGNPGRVDLWLDRGLTEPLQALEGVFEYRSDRASAFWAVDPPDGGQAGGRLVRLFGTGFDSLRADKPSVRFEDAEVANYEIIDDATIHLWSPRGEPSQATVWLGNQRMAKAFQWFDPRAPYGGTGGGPSLEALNVTVLDAETRKPVEAAFVILGEDPDSDLQGLTDTRGQITLSTEGLKGPYVVTAAKDQHTTSSVVSFEARNLTLLLFNFVPPEPGNGGGGGQTSPSGSVSGTVTGFDKYILPPPGDCDAKELGDPGTLCTPCEQDADCIEPDARCSDLGLQGKRCTVACEGVSDCNLEAGYICANLGFGRTQCIPEPGVKVARCSSTVSSVFSRNSLERFQTDVEQRFELELRPGEYAIVCIGGYVDPTSQVFTPMRMGVRRHVFLSPGESLSDQDVHLDVLLNRDMHIRLDGAPLGEDEALTYHEIDVALDFGSDGVFPMPSRGSAEGTNEFVLSAFPSVLEGSLADASYTFFGAAYGGNPDNPTTSLSAASYVVIEGVKSLARDSVIALLPSGFEQQSTGIIHDVHALSGWGGARMWGVGEGGRVMVNDGAYWALQQTPTTASLRAVWAANDAYAWAVGDEGTVIRWDGLGWRWEQLPKELSLVDWWAVAGMGQDVWIAGEAGVWRFDGSSWQQVMSNGPTRLRVVRDIWIESPDQVWLVGDHGLIRRWTRDGLVRYDLPGANLIAVHGSMGSDVWAVGEHGRMLHWDGERWFERLPLTHHTLRAVDVVDPLLAWAVGDSGIVLRWDGDEWLEHAQPSHVDLRGVHQAGDGRVAAAGVHTVIVGPFLGEARAISAHASSATAASSGLKGTPSVGFPNTYELRWQARGPEAELTVLSLTDTQGFGFWSFLVDGGLLVTPLPNLNAAWGLEPLWAGDGSVLITRALSPGFDLDAFDLTMVNQFQWRAWSRARLPVNYTD